MYFVVSYFIYNLYNCNMLFVTSLSFYRRSPLREDDILLAKCYRTVNRWVRRWVLSYKSLGVIILLWLSFVVILLTPPDSLSQLINQMQHLCDNFEAFCRGVVQRRAPNLGEWIYRPNVTLVGTNRTITIIHGKFDPGENQSP